MQNRVAILDVLDGAVADPLLVDEVIQNFRDHTGTKGLCYGAAYFPWLITGIVLRAEISFMNLPVNLGLYLEKEAPVLHALEAVTALRSASVHNSTKPDQLQLIQEAHTALLAVSKKYQQLITAALAVANVLPPSGAMAGMYRFTDTTRGISKAPVNVTLAAVIAPTVNLTDTQQMGLNVDASGKSINALRAFSMKGVMAWGAKTLADNDPDFRYINVRRTMIMIEQSVQTAARAFVFEPNDAHTWVSLKMVLENYLTELWKKGTAVGTTPAEAFSVLIGLGETMSADDILQGYLRVTVLVAVSHATEFIECTVLQEMQKG
jgi:phage tail sheath protein FI